MSPEDLPNELRAFEAELADLVPRADRLDPLRVMYLAGRASARRRARAWPVAFVAMSAVAAVLAVMLATGPAPRATERIVYLPAEPAGTTHVANPPQVAPPPAPRAPRRAASPGWFGGTVLAWFTPAPMALAAEPALDRPYPRFRDYVLAHGLDAWPQPPSSDSTQRSDRLRTRGDWEKLLLEKRS